MSDVAIAEGHVVGIAYKLSVDGETIDEAAADDPVEYLHGAMNVVPGLEAALAGRHVGDKLTVSVAPEQGFGEYDPEEVEWFDRDEFEDADELEPGMLLAVEDDDGELYDAVVAEVTADAVALDFNPPLAGKTLVFDVEVISVREADADELDHGHPHALDDVEGDEDYPVLLR